MVSYFNSLIFASLALTRYGSVFLYNLRQCCLNNRKIDWDICS